MRLILIIILFLIPPGVIFSQNTTDSRMKVEQIIESALKSYRDGKFSSEMKLYGSLAQDLELYNQLHLIENLVIRLKLAKRYIEIGQTKTAIELLDSILNINQQNFSRNESRLFISELEKLRKLISSKNPITEEQGSEIKEIVLAILTDTEILRTLVYPTNNKFLSKISNTFGPDLGGPNYSYVLTTLGKSEDLKGNLHMATRNYYLAYGIDLALNKTVISASSVKYLSNYLINSGQIETFRTITRPILNYATSYGNFYSPEYFNFLTQYWLNLLVIGDFKNAVLVERNVEKILERYEIAPVEGLRSFIEAKWLSAILIYNRDPKITSDAMHIKYEKLINLNEIKKLEADFLLLYRIMYKNIFNISEINKSELKYLNKLSGTVNENYFLYGLINSLIAVYHRNDPVNAIGYLEKSTKSLVNSWNALLRESYANQHKLNKYYEASISININLVKYLLKNFDTKILPGIYEILLTHTNILNSAETSISIMNSSNNPDIYDRINKSRRLLYKRLNEEIIEINNLNQKKLNDADKKEFNLLFWNDYKRLVDLLLYQNGLLHKNNRFSDPIEKNTDRFIERHLKNSNKILFTVSIIGNQAVQTCYSNNRKYVRIELLDKNYKEKIKKLRISTDPTLTPGNNFEFSLANTLYRNFFGLLNECHLSGKIVYLSIDPSLYNLPINALLTKPSTKFDNDFWFPLNYNYSILPFNNLLKKKYRKRNFTKYLGIGNPKYKSKTDEFKINLDTEELIITRNSDGFKEIVDLQPLPYTGDEINNSKTLFKKSKVLLGENATEKNFRDTNLSNFDVIQFATHGLVTGEFNRVKKPGLALAYPEQNQSWFNDGYLSSEEIAQLPLDGQIVILSACNTAVDSGAKYNFGLSELSNSFLEAGARMIVVTQWPIVSKTSSEFMYKFLSAFKKPEPNPLGKTIIHFIQNTAYSHPKYWAPFIIIGNHSPGNVNNDAKFSKVAVTELANDNKGILISGIKVENNVFATIGLDKGKTLLLKLDLDGKVNFKKIIKGRGSKILGKYGEKLYISFYKRDKNTKMNIGEFNYKKNSYKTVFDLPSKTSSFNKLFKNLKKLGSERIFSGEIIKDHLYAFMSFENNDKKDDEPKYHEYLLKMNLTDYSKSIYKFPISDSGSQSDYDHSYPEYFKALIYPESGFFSDKINILVTALNIDREENERRFTIHYKISNGELIKLREYENKSVAGYLPENKLFYGLVHEKIDYNLAKNRYVLHSGNSDLAFFYLDDESLKIAKQFRFPGDQEVTKVIKMDDNFLLLGTNKTPLTWEFGELKLLMENDKIFSTDPMLVLFNKKLSYLDSKIFVQSKHSDVFGFYSGTMSISKINERRFMLFNDTPENEISVNEINEFAEAE